MEVQQLIASLSALTEQNKAAAMDFLKLEESQLNFKPFPEKWSVLECIEHLNRYGRFYLPEIESRMAKSQHAASATFKPGILGDYFAKSMEPSPNMKTMNTFKSMNPIASELHKGCIEEFIEQQDRMMACLETSKAKNLTKIKTSITISNWIKLRLGDTFRVVINHNWRHVLQAQNTLSLQSASEPVT